MPNGQYSQFLSFMAKLLLINFSENDIQSELSAKLATNFPYTGL